MEQFISVAVSLAIALFVLSTVVSAIIELINVLLNQRGLALRRFILDMLDDELGEKVLQHSLVKAYYKPLWRPLWFPPLWRGIFWRSISKGSALWGKDESTDPSYLPAETFARALMDIVVKQYITSGGKPQPLPFSTIQAAVNALTGQQTQRAKDALIPLVDGANFDVEGARASIERWYDGVMERATGWYKRYCTALLFVVSLGLACALNLDALEIIRRTLLSSFDKTVVAFVTTTSARSWANLPGWLLTSLLATLGAPFWFDLVGRLINVRGTGERPSQTQH